MNRTMIGAVAVVLLAGGLLFGMVAMSRRPAVPSGVESVRDDSAPSLPNGILTEYTLTERSGKKFHSRDLTGTVHVVNFFFSKCPTACRSQTTAVDGIAEEFGPKGVKFLSITCDPDNDTPVALSLYADEFKADPDQWLFLTGNLMDLRRVGGEMYQLHVDVGTHSESLIVVDKWGKIRERFSWKDAKEITEMKKLLAELLAESAPPK